MRLEVGVGELAPRGRIRNRAPVRPRHGFRQRQEVRPHTQSRLVRGPRVRVRPLDGARARVEPRVRRRPRPRRRERHGPEAPAGRRPARPRRPRPRFPPLVPRRPRHGAPAGREAPVRRPSRARPRARFLRERRGDGPRVPVVRQEPAAERSPSPDRRARRYSADRGPSFILLGRRPAADRGRRLGRVRRPCRGWCACSRCPWERSTCSRGPCSSSSVSVQVALPVQPNDAHCWPTWRDYRRAGRACSAAAPERPAKAKVPWYLRYLLVSRILAKGSL